MKRILSISLAALVIALLVSCATEVRMNNAMTGTSYNTVGDYWYINYLPALSTNFYMKYGSTTWHVGQLAKGANSDYKDVGEGSSSPIFTMHYSNNDAQVYKQTLTKSMYWGKYTYGIKKSGENDTLTAD